jgi:hypothetical protein
MSEATSTLTRTEGVRRVTHETIEARIRDRCYIGHEPAQTAQEEGVELHAMKLLPEAKKGGRIVFSEFVERCLQDNAKGGKAYKHRPLAHEDSVEGPHPNNVSSTAMRTATPLATWRRMHDCAPSATSSVISTPRLIGPGCSTTAPGAARRRRSAVRP